MDFDLKSLQITNWYKAVIAISAPILFLAIAKDKDIVAIISCGTLVFGIGEWINHPKSVEHRPAPALGRFVLITDYPWKPKLLGVVFDLAAVILVGYGLFRAFGH